ncbi:hypothetical protein [Limosilactobacillus fermentum]|uniref:hypothetical protein n=1 Tax=Limosilactobacillus fermentum TaxID=1613 RepID=UPI0021A86A9D|nr:hypothetical protein [Limosilactobacillus fermentum]
MVAAYLAAYDRKKKWWQTNRKQQDVLYWAGWAFFSVANFFHPYYTIMLAPPLAVLAALAITSGTNCQIKRNFVPKKTSNGLFQPKTLRGR